MPTSSVTSTDLTERARAVALVADQHAEFGDTEGRLADPVVDALHREGLFGMWVPKSVPGGAELDPVSSLQVIENLTYGDPSAGWVLMAAALAVGTGAAYPQRRGSRRVVRTVASAGHRRPGHAARNGRAKGTAFC